MVYEKKRAYLCSPVDAILLLCLNPPDSIKSLQASRICILREQSAVWLDISVWIYIVHLRAPPRSLLLARIKTNLYLFLLNACFRIQNCAYDDFCFLEKRVVRSNNTIQWAAILWWWPKRRNIKQKKKLSKQKVKRVRTVISKVRFWVFSQGTSQVQYSPTF